MLLNLDINSYIRDDNSLDYQRIYKEMEEMTGFMSKERRENHYHTVVELYESFKKGEFSHNANNGVDLGDYLS